MKAPRFPSLTPLRTLVLLRDTETGGDSWKIQRLRDALADHLKHALTKKRRGKR